MKPKSKVHKEGVKPRSNSFKLGSRPREVKDQVRKTYRRNSFTDKDNNRILKEIKQVEVIPEEEEKQILSHVNRVHQVIDI